MNRRMVIGGVAAAALIVAALATHGFGLFTPAPTALTLYGNVDVRQVDLAFRVPGRIARLAVDEGARVSAGQELARLDPRPLNDALAAQTAQVALAEADLAKRQAGNRPQEVQQAEATLAAQAARYDAARAEAARQQGLVTSGAVSQRQFDAARADAEAARAQLQSARAALGLQRAGSRREDIAAAQAQRGVAQANRNRAATDLADAVLTAPEAGIVLSRAREPGAIVQPGEAVYTLTIDHPLRVRAFVAEPDLPRLAPGVAVVVTADGNPRAYHGTVGAIAANAEFTPKSVQTESLRADLVYRVRIIVSDGDGALRQGQPVTVRIAGGK